jgi:hypothetical protein
MLARIRKALWAGVTSGVGVLGIDLTGIGTLEWWQPLAVAFITGFVTYWAKPNEPGTLLHAPRVPLDYEGDGEDATPYKGDTNV